MESAKTETGETGIGEIGNWRNWKCETGIGETGNGETGIGETGRIPQIKLIYIIKIIKKNSYLFF